MGHGRLLARRRLLLLVYSLFSPYRKYFASGGCCLLFFFCKCWNVQVQEPHSFRVCYSWFKHEKQGFQEFLLLVKLCLGHIHRTGKDFQLVILSVCSGLVQNKLWKIFCAEIFYIRGIRRVLFFHSALVKYQMKQLKSELDRKSEQIQVQICI
jgi:hypothetical protein